MEAPRSDPFARDRIAAEIANTYDFVAWAPLVFTSAVTGQNVTKIFDLATEIDVERGKRIPTVELNKFLREMVDAHPPAGLKNRLPKLNYMVQETDNPIPAFKIFASHTQYVHWSYRRYLEKGLRERYGYAGTPIQIWFIEKHETHKHGNSPTLEVTPDGVRVSYTDVMALFQRRPQADNPSHIPPSASTRTCSSSGSATRAKNTT
jgi:hypothetical protein